MSNLLEVRDLATHFFTKRGVCRAVQGVSFSVAAGETLGLVGESGCGKTITSLSIMGLVPKPAGRIVRGQILFEGEDLLAKTEAEMRKIRGSQISMILQDPMSSLNPAFTIGNQVGEGVAFHLGLRGKSLRERIEELLRLVRIHSPELTAKYYPHQMSGGMRQRVGGAIATACHPKLLIADEPTTALDVTIQAQYLQLLKELQGRFGIAIIFITHDLGIVAKMCDRVAVMYAGKIVELVDTERLFDNPSHPYTIALLRSLPRIDEKADKLYAIAGQPPSLTKPIRGCSFAPRCDRAIERCRQEAPPLIGVEDGHLVQCGAGAKVLVG